jgi:hypothetical protein
MRVLTKFFIILLVLVCLYSCKDKETDANTDELIFRYYQLENRGWKSKKNEQKVDDILFTATDVPLQYYILKELGNEDILSVDSVYQQNQNERIIEFTFEQDNEDDLLDKKFTQLDYESSVKYMSFSIEKDFYVVNARKDTIQCSGVLFERNFKTAPYTKILLFFAGLHPEEQIQLIYNDQLFRKGTMKFTITDPPLKL